MQLKGIFILDSKAYDLIFGPEERAAIARLVDLVGPAQTRASIARSPELLAGVDVMFGGWGSPVLDQAFISSAPKLKALFYGAGTLSHILTPAVWERSLTITTALEANAIPVAEYALATILFSLKHGWRLWRETRAANAFVERNEIPGCYGATIGLVSLGAVGRKLVQLLKAIDVNVIVYDPFVSDEAAAAIGVDRVDLLDLFSRSDVVSLHPPLLPETRGMIGTEHFDRLKPGATVINTSRGQIIRHDDLIEVAQRRSDLQFVLDVAEPEPPPVGSPLYVLPNVVLTPHIAGSSGPECRRMGRYMVEELQRYVSGKPLRWAVSAESIKHTSHRPARIPRAPDEHVKPGPRSQRRDGLAQPLSGAST